MFFFIIRKIEVFDLKNANRVIYENIKYFNKANVTLDVFKGYFFRLLYEIVNFMQMFINRF